MIKNKKKIRIFLIALILIFISSYNVYAMDNNLETLIIMLDELSFKDIDKLDLNNKSIGLMNIKTRKPYSEESLYRTLNTGRKISKKELNKRDIELEYLGDILESEGLSYLAEEGSYINFLIGDSNDKSKGFNKNIEYNPDYFNGNIDNIFKNNNILALEYDLKKNKENSKILKDILDYNINKDRNIYLIPRNVSKEDSKYINKYLVPIIFLDGKSSGVLTSDSTKRDGIIAIEDISVDIKDSYGYKNELEIGKKINIINNKEPIKKLKLIYKESINLLLIASIFHGIFYIAQVLMFFNIFKGKKYEWIEKVYLFANNNILITLFIAFLNMQNSLILYLLCTIILNVLITEFMHKERKVLSFSFFMTYILIIYGIIFNSDMIYNSYMGFNNLVYGARFYGFNNGIAAVLLSTSILLIYFINKSRMLNIFKKMIMFLIPIINIIVLSTEFGANTGGFITAILLFILNTYYYFKPKNISYGNILLFIIVGIIIFGINIYVDSLSNNKSHAVQFIMRIQENGIKELYYMANFKLKELLKLTIMPPFSIVLIIQFLSVKKIYRRHEIDVKILLLTSILGFIINDTGNILLIYMLNFLILKLYFYDDSIFESIH